MCVTYSYDIKVEWILSDYKNIRVYTFGKAFFGTYNNIYKTF